MGRMGGALAAAALVVSSLGCSEIRLKTIDTQARVLSSRREVVPAQVVLARARMVGTTLLLEAVQGCEVVERQEVELVGPHRGIHRLGASVLVLGGGLAPGCSLQNVEGPDVTCEDLECGRINACAEGIITQCLDGQTVRWHVCTSDTPTTCARRTRRSRGLTVAKSLRRTARAAAPSGSTVARSGGAPCA